jgi:hypothetical protein
MSSDVKTEETAASDQPFIGPVARVQPGILLNGSLSVPSGQLVNGKTHGKDLGGFINGSAPIAGWFIMENPIKKWMMTRGPTILGNLHLLGHHSARGCFRGVLSLLPFGNPWFPW